MVDLKKEIPQGRSFHFLNESQVFLACTLVLRGREESKSIITEWEMTC